MPVFLNDSSSAAWASEDRTIHINKNGANTILLNIILALWFHTSPNIPQRILRLQRTLMHA